MGIDHGLDLLRVHLEATDIDDSAATAFEIVPPGALFYPIDPGHEDESWQRFYDEALPRFFAGTYAGPYMNEQIARFEALLPERPPWGRP